MAPHGSIVVHPAARVRGRLRVPGDKSISHRYALLAALAEGQSVVRHYAPGADCDATRSCLGALGVPIDAAASTLTIIGRGMKGLSSPAGALDARNSGTTTRLLAGVLAAQPFSATITGDDSLRRRPMRRVVTPLHLMGARIETTDGRLPMTISGGALRGIEYRTEVPSAQVKSAVLLAGLQADGTTRVIEGAATRNHTELALRRFGAVVRVEGLRVEVDPAERLQGVDAAVPGDFSSAAFWWAAAAGVPGGDVTVDDVGLNPTRRALLDVLARAGAQVEESVEDASGGEPWGRVRVRHGAPPRLVIEPAEVPGLIDELPALAALATHGGEMVVTGASELRVKESDRITALVTGLRALGADAEELPDGFRVHGREPLEGGRADAAGDHRLAMAFTVAALGARGACTIDGADSVGVSYPGFFAALASLTA